MADPVGILGLAAPVLKVVFDVTKRVHTFVSEVKEVRDSIDALSAELLVVSASLQVIKHVQRTIPPGKTIDHSIADPIAQALQTSMSGCQTTLDRFGKAVDKLGNTTNSKAGRMICQIKLDWSKEHISVLRSQLQSHTSALTLVLPMINLVVAFVAPNAVIVDLTPRIDEVEERMKRLPSTGGSNPGGAIEGASAEVDCIKSSAENLISCAKTLVEESEAGASTVDAQEATSMLPPTTTFWNCDWEDNESNADTVGSLEVSIVKNYLVIGLREFDLLNYERAITFLVEGVERAKSLPQQTRNEDEIKRSELTLAICLFKLGQIEEAKERLSMLVQEDSGIISSADILSAKHILAKILFQQGQVDEAEPHCYQALEGRSRPRLKQQLPESFKETGILRVEILKAQGRHNEAEATQEMFSPSSGERLTQSPWEAGSPPAVPPSTSFTASPVHISREMPIPLQAAQSTFERSVGDVNLVRRINSTMIVANPQADPIVSGSTRNLSFDTDISNKPIREPLSISTSPLSMVSPPGSARPNRPESFGRRQSEASVGSDTSQSRGIPNHAQPSPRAPSFCKGTKAIRSSGLDAGMETMNDRGVMVGLCERWRACKKCEFQSDRWRPEKGEQPTDRVSKHDCGISYKWSFLAGSHLPQHKGDKSFKYGCLICSVEETVNNDAYSEGELIQHICDIHAAKTCQNVQNKTRCFFGEIRPDTSWDLRFAQQCEGEPIGVRNRSQSAYPEGAAPDALGIRRMTDFT